MELMRVLQGAFGSGGSRASLRPPHQRPLGWRGEGHAIAPHSHHAQTGVNDQALQPRYRGPGGVSRLLVNERGGSNTRFGIGALMDR